MDHISLCLRQTLASVLLSALGAVALAPSLTLAQAMDAPIDPPMPVERTDTADETRQRCLESVSPSNSSNETLWCDLLVDELNRNTQRTPADNLALLSAYHNRAAVLIRSAQFEQADADLAEALRLDPNHQALHLTLGNLRFAEKRFDEALRSYNQAIASSNGAVPGYFINRALALRGLGQMDLALEDVMRARTQAAGGGVRLRNPSPTLSPSGTGEAREDEFL